MNANAKKWVDALRSGEYTQDRGRLSRGGAYCCLGVACELYAGEVGDLIVTRHALGDRFDGDSVALPKKVQDWLGLGSEFGGFELNGATSLATLNDRGESFDVIANVIESEPAQLFRAEE